MQKMTDYIIVQAGGRGSRLKSLTDNKPKALVPIFNLPMIFHLFQRFPDSRFIIIADYKAEVLEKYLSAFATVKYRIVYATGNTGTCAGISRALKFIPKQKPFMLIWSDLILGKNFEVPRDVNNYVGLSTSFLCRWKFENNEFAEEPSKEYGVAGIFFFKDRQVIADVSADGEFVRWLSKNQVACEGFPVNDVKEFGILPVIEELQEEKCRPFNKIEEIDGDIVKTALDDQGRLLAVREKAWYQAVMKKGYTYIPEIYSYEPFRMEKINGKNIYEYQNLSFGQKRDILEKIVYSLKELHNMENRPADMFSIWEACIAKTFKRLNQVRDLIPFANNPVICINGKNCRNVFFYQDELKKMVDSYMPDHFCMIHGDCTFSNILLKNDITPVLIDPRGYYGYEELFGDESYDWAKIYYSIKGNYDQFNRKRFSLKIDDEQVHLHIETNGWEDMEPVFWEMLGNHIEPSYIKLFHAIIWLSLTTYAWEDYDSICGAFYNGLFYLEEALQ